MSDVFRIDIPGNDDARDYDEFYGRSLITSREGDKIRITVRSGPGGFGDQGVATIVLTLEQVRELLPHLADTVSAIMAESE